MYNHGVRRKQERHGAVMNNFEKRVTHSKLATSMHCMVSDLEFNSEVQRERESKRKERVVERFKKSRCYRRLKYFSVKK